jgi:microcystin degradation protein MlrC
MSKSKPRIVIGGLGAESNSFSLERPGQHDAEVMKESELISTNLDRQTVIGGFIEAFKSRPVNLLPLPRIWWGATGVIDRKSYNWAKNLILRRLGGYAKVDGVLLDLHGAMQAEGIEDAEGVLMKEVRAIIGETPLVCVVDSHANMTDLKLANADMILPYKTNPHIDLYARGLKAGELSLKIIDGKIHPTSHLERLPLLGNNLGMSTWASTAEVQSHLPMNGIVAKIAELETKEKVLDVSVIIGFGQANISQSVTSVLAITDADEELAKRVAIEIATLLWKARDDFLKIRPLVPVDEAIDEAVSDPGKPIVLVDVGDNSGGGAPCDNTVILEALLRNGVQDAVVPLRDPDAVARCFRAGVGATIRLQVGGKLDSRFYNPVRIKARVKTLGDGIYTIRGPSHEGFGPSAAGESAPLGALPHFGRNPSRMALLSTGAIDVIVSEGKTGMERDFYKAIGVDPAERKIVVVKSHQAHRASFEPIAKRIIEVDTPGITSPLFRGLTLRNPPKGSYVNAC